MKLSTFTQAAILMLTTAFAAGCGASHSASRYPERRDYPGRNPNESPVHRLPPGHAKKVYGHQSAKVYAPGHRKKYRHGTHPLIITGNHTMKIWRTPEGRTYYKNSAGFYYWQGYDDRFYLDERFLTRNEYDHYAYEEWKDRGRNNARRYKKRRN